MFSGFWFRPRLKPRSPQPITKSLKQYQSLLFHIDHAISYNILWSCANFCLLFSPHIILFCTVKSYVHCTLYIVRHSVTRFHCRFLLSPGSIPFATTPVVLARGSFRYCGKISGNLKRQQNWAIITASTSAGTNKFFLLNHVEYVKYFTIVWNKTHN